MRDRLAPRLARDTAAAVPVVLLFTRHASTRFGEITQTLNWPLADGTGRWIGLSLDYEGEGNARIPALEQTIRDERFWAVVAIGSLEDDRIALRPYALWGTRQILLDFAPGAKAQDKETFMAWVRRLASNRAAGPDAFITLDPITDTLLKRAWGLLVRRAEAGQRNVGMPADAVELSQMMERAGLEALAQVFATNETGKGAALRAAYALITARKSRAQLPWMV